MKAEISNTSGLFFIIPSIVVEPNPREGAFEIGFVWLFVQLSFTFGA